jgi:hypothetical protein
MPLNVLVTATPLFLRRHWDIFEGLAPYFGVNYLAEPAVPYARRAAFKLGSFLHRHAPQAITAATEWLGSIHPYDARVFIARSQALESQTSCFMYSVCVAHLGRGRAFPTR